MPFAGHFCMIVVYKFPIAYFKANDCVALTAAATTQMARFV